MRIFRLCLQVFRIVVHRSHPRKAIANNRENDWAFVTIARADPSGYVIASRLKAEHNVIAENTKRITSNKPHQRSEAYAHEKDDADHRRRQKEKKE